MSKVVENLSPLPSPRAGALHGRVSSILKKYAVAVSGLAMVGFLVVHLIGNLTLFLGVEVFDHYAAALGGNPMLIPVELVLLGIFLVHVALAIVLTLGNCKATPDKATVSATRGKATLASRTMIWSGSLMLLFVVFHLVHMKFAHMLKLFGMPADMPLSAWVKQTLASPPIAAIYIVAMVAVGLHVSHAIWSSFQTLGLDNRRIHDRLFAISRIIGWVLAIGFIAIVIWALVR